MATHSSVLAWRIPGTGEPAGLPSMGLHRVGHDWSDLARYLVFFILLWYYRWELFIDLFLYSQGFIGQKFFIRLGKFLFTTQYFFFPSFYFLSFWDCFPGAPLCVQNVRSNQENLQFCFYVKVISFLLLLSGCESLWASLSHPSRKPLVPLSGTFSLHSQSNKF